ncbi:hypothetical protein DVH26_10395 [Paenibacillus sp. H1-7]|nr:hypothetical protein DVH26_10395 [Paenibacillus sp. H1-7]
MEAHESLTAAVQREFLEEAGINVQIKENAGVSDYLIPYELPKRGTSIFIILPSFIWFKLSVVCLQGLLKSSKDKIH